MCQAFECAADLICTDDTCKWFDPLSPHYVHDHEQMDEIAKQEAGLQ